MTMFRRLLIIAILFYAASVWAQAINTVPVGQGAGKIPLSVVVPTGCSQAINYPSQNTFVCAPTLTPTPSPTATPSATPTAIVDTYLAGQGIGSQAAFNGPFPNCPYGSAYSTGTHNFACAPTPTTTASTTPTPSATPTALADTVFQGEGVGNPSSYHALANCGYGITYSTGSHTWSCAPTVTASPSATPTAVADTVLQGEGVGTAATFHALANCGYGITYSTGTHAWSCAPTPTATTTTTATPSATPTALADTYFAGQGIGSQAAFNGPFTNCPYGSAYSTSSHSFACAPTATATTTPTPTSTPTPALSGIGACAASNWASTLNANAAPTCTQPAFSDISSTVGATQLSAQSSTAAFYRQLLANNTNTVVQATTNGATMFLGINGGVGNATEANAAVPLGVVGVFKNLSCYVRNAPGASNSYAITVRDSTTPADTAVTCTISTAATSCQDTTHSATSTANRLYTFKSVLTVGGSAPSASIFACSVEFDI